MHRQNFFIVLLLFSAPAVPADYEKQAIENCARKSGGVPTETAMCAGQVLPNEKIQKCINEECFGKNKELEKALVSFYGQDIRGKQPCGNIKIDTLAVGTSTFSPNKTWKLCSGVSIVFQADGNLVINNKDGKVVWSSGTHESGADKLVMHANGDLVIYKGPYPVWSSGTYGNHGSSLALQEDGNLVIYNRYQKPIWTTGTYRK